MIQGLVALCLIAATGGLSSAEITAQLAQSLVSGSRLELIDFNSTVRSECSLVSVQSSRPIVASGRYAIKIMGRRSSGTRCHGWAWATIRVLAKVMIATQRIEPGESISQKVRTAEREQKPGQKPIAKIPSGAKAATLLLPGAVLEKHHLRIGPAIGESVKVEVRTGQISIVQIGRVVPCVAGRLCAQLESGKRLEGQYKNGRLVVEVP